MMNSNRRLSMTPKPLTFVEVRSIITNDVISKLLAKARDIKKGEFR
jgi:hypothetical protein